MKSKTRGLAISAVIAAIYAVVTLMPGINMFSYGPLQFRVSEALTVLPIFTPWAIPGLTVGCFLSNILSSVGPLDMLFGTTATLLASVCTYYMRRMPKFISVLPAVIFNGVIIGFMITYFYMDTAGNFMSVLIYNMATVSIGELAVCYILGLPLAIYMEKHKIFKI